MYPGHVPNWDLVSELVNQVSRIYRSPIQCKQRFETAILPREEGKLTTDPLTKKQKKLKGMNQLMSHVSVTIWSVVDQNIGRTLSPCYIITVQVYKKFQNCSVVFTR